MFTNPGRKLKILALVNFWFIFGSGILVAIGLFVASAMAAGSSTARYGSYGVRAGGEGSIVMILIAIVVLIVSFVIAWLSSIHLYAFGQQVEDTAALRDQLELVYAKLETPATPAPKASAFQVSPEFPDIDTYHNDPRITPYN